MMKNLGCLGKLKRRKKKAKSRLTDWVIDKLQNYFGIALRSKVGNAKEMQDAILASMFMLRRLMIVIIIHIAPQLFFIIRDNNLPYYMQKDC